MVVLLLDLCGLVLLIIGWVGWVCSCRWVFSFAFRFCGLLQLLVVWSVWLFIGCFGCLVLFGGCVWFVLLRFGCLGWVGLG